MSATQFQALLRQLLTLVGGYLVGAGYLDAVSAETAVGALAALGGVGWSLYAARKTGVVVAASKIPEVSEIVMRNSSNIPDTVPSEKVTRESSRQ